MSSTPTFADRPAKPIVGDAWAYRSRSNDPLLEVVVEKIGVKRPQRVRIRFVDDEFEGRQEWVPPARLKALWKDRQRFVAWEARWDAVTGLSPDLDSPEESAASLAFELLIDPGLATVGYNATAGVVFLTDVDALAAELEMDIAALRSDPLSFEDGGRLVASWRLTELIVKRAVERDPNRVLRYVEKEEAEARRDAIFGRHDPRRGRADAWAVPPELCARIDEEHDAPVRRILREWCGAEAVTLRAEADALRQEAQRLAGLAASAAEALRRSGAEREAAKLERELR